jgi:hypothetical protein
MIVHEWEEKYLNSHFGAIPTRCPECGGTQIVRLIWKPGLYYSGPIKSAVDAGKAIFAGAQNRGVAPPWACLACQPVWLTVHQLTLEDERTQIQKEDAIAQMDFDTAIHYRDLQGNIKRRQRELIEALTGGFPPRNKPAH